MKKLLALFLMFVLVSAVFTGCGASKEIDREAMKEEIKAEMEAEAAKQKEKDAAENKEQDDEKEQTETVAAADIKDMDAVYKFVKQELGNVERADFDRWIAASSFSFDITGDGADELLLTDILLENMLIISGEGGKIKRIPSNIPLAKYENIPAFEDGFLQVLWKTGGTGEIFGGIDLYIYNGMELVKVLDSLECYHMVSFPDTNYEETATIEGKLNDFVYTYTIHEGETATVVKERYTYNSNAMRFDVESLERRTVGSNVDSNVLQSTAPTKPAATPEPEPVYVEEPEPVYVEEPEPVYVEEPEPVYVEEPEPILSSTGFENETYLNLSQGIEEYVDYENNNVVYAGQYNGVNKSKLSVASWGEGKITSYFVVMGEVENVMIEEYEYQFLTRDYLVKSKTTIQGTMKDTIFEIHSGFQVRVYFDVRLADGSMKRDLCYISRQDANRAIQYPK